MDWLELKIDTSHAGLDAVTDMLEQQGVTGVMIDDEADFQSFLENNRQYWDYVDDDLLAQKKGVSRVTFYLERNEDAYGTVAAVRMAMSALKKDHPEYAPLLLTMADVADEDWENNWKQFYKPMEIGSRLLVVPEWEEAADPTRVKLVLNPGLTFGTGSHATTRLCLQALDTHIHGGERVLDVGCGSGALTVACAKRNLQGRMLGIDRWGKEYASFSLPLCEKNAAAEGVKNISFQRGNAVKLDFPDESFDAVTSNYVYHNITGEDKQALLLETLRVLKKGGTFAIHDLMSERRYGDMQAFVQKLREMGYERVELIDTTTGKFMAPKEARRLMLHGSTLLVGRK